MLVNLTASKNFDILFEQLSVVPPTSPYQSKLNCACFSIRLIRCCWFKIQYCDLLNVKAMLTCDAKAITFRAR